MDEVRLALDAFKRTKRLLIALMAAEGSELRLKEIDDLAQLEAAAERWDKACSETATWLAKKEGDEG